MATRGENRKAYQAAYQKSHREEILARGAAYRKTHKEEIAARVAAHYKEHKEEIIARVTKYRKTHKEEIAARKANYNEKNKEKIATYLAVWSVARRYNISRRDAEMLVALRDGEGAWCDICHTTDGPFHIDHDHARPLPQSIRGILCYYCNMYVAALDNGFPLDAAFAYLTSA